MPWTLAVHWLIWPSGTVVGMKTVTDVIVEGAAVTVTACVLDFVESWALVAVIVDLPEDGTEAGAVSSPEFEIVPASAVHVTAEL